MPKVYPSQGIDPSGIAEGFGAIAKALGPPSPQDMLAGAKAQEIRANQSRLADLYAYAGRPDFDQGLLDRRAGIAGAYAPNQSVTAVDRNNATSRFNNAADNARALEQARLQQAGDTTRAMLAPVPQGATRFVPSSVASMYGTDPTQTGVVELKPGEQSVLPDGRTLAGPGKPLTMDELRAVVFGKLPENEKRAAVLGSTPVESVETPDGPRIAFRADAVGQAPARPAVAPSPLLKLETELAAMAPGDPRIPQHQAAIAAAGRGATVDPFRAHADTEAAKAYAEMAHAGQTARNFGSDVDLVGELLSDAPTGITGPTRLKVANYAREIGLNDVADGLTGGRMDRMTAANAIVQRLAPALRVPGSGAQSDRELQNFLASLPSIATQPGGNRLILETLRGGAAYKQAVGEIAQRALRGEISRADADAQIAAVPTPFARFSAPRPAPAASTQPVRVQTIEEARRLPSGTPIILPDGGEGRVP